ncbi:MULTISPECIES: DUF6728 family protein [Rufibacter]|uniref:Uncharacterized protein n=1 Tax=Rufibacter quisquiliarum TaxID=1549639 RepID=A0A839GI19_9BACT|nr:MULTISPECIES: DUF6728 family protein [Rufibacter]MBA9077313.1 hypothetical protein [Rufibacter quisquiliarum]
MKGLFDFTEVATYFFRKKDPNRKTNFNLRTMHTINKISMLMFLCGFIYLVLRWLS